MTQFSYYPGCSLSGTGREFRDSAEAVCRRLGVTLREIPDWSCCGATSGHSVSHFLAVALPARNLALAAPAALPIAVPCAACYNRMKRAASAIARDPHLRKDIENRMAVDLSTLVPVRHLLEVFVTDLGLDALRAQVQTPLTGLKVAAYYGCLLVRPKNETGFDDPENPRTLDDIAAACGAEPVRWYFKTECCGASLAVPRADIVAQLCQNIVRHARDAGADCIVTACPLCQLNLDSRQGDLGLPVLYFTQLIGLALGVPRRELSLHTHLTDTSGVQPKPPAQHAVASAST